MLPFIHSWGKHEPAPPSELSDGILSDIHICTYICIIPTYVVHPVHACICVHMHIHYACTCDPIILDSQKSSETIEDRLLHRREQDRAQPWCVVEIAEQRQERITKQRAREIGQGALPRLPFAQSTWQANKIIFKSR